MSGLKRPEPVDETGAGKGRLGCELCRGNTVMICPVCEPGKYEMSARQKERILQRAMKDGWQSA